jgi:hypothetical protein
MQHKKKIVWYQNHMFLNQAICSGLEFAFVSEDFKQCCPFVLCKDYLQDAIYNQIYKTKKKIFGFQYDPSKESPVCLSKAQLVIANSTDRKLRQKIPACLDFLNQIEKKLKINKTKIRECESPPNKYSAGGVWFFEGSKRWLASPPMISLYTLLIRVGFTHVEGKNYWSTIEDICARKIPPYQYEDFERLKGSIKGIERILDQGDRKIFSSDFKVNYPKGLKINTLHNNLGICAFSEGATKKHVPYWHKDKSK